MLTRVVRQLLTAPGAVEQFATDFALPDTPTMGSYLALAPGPQALKVVGVVLRPRPLDGEQGAAGRRRVHRLGAYGEPRGRPRAWLGADPRPAPAAGVRVISALWAASGSAGRVSFAGTTSSARQQGSVIRAHGIGLLV